MMTTIWLIKKKSLYLTVLYLAVSQKDHNYHLFLEDLTLNSSFGRQGCLLLSLWWLLSAATQYRTETTKVTLIYFNLNISCQSKWWLGVKKEKEAVKDKMRWWWTITKIILFRRHVCIASGLSPDAPADHSDGDADSDVPFSGPAPLSHSTAAHHRPLPLFSCLFLFLLFSLLLAPCGGGAAQKGERPVLLFLFYTFFLFDCRKTKVCSGYSRKSRLGDMGWKTGCRWVRRRKIIIILMIDMITPFRPTIISIIIIHITITIRHIKSLGAKGKKDEPQKQKKEENKKEIRMSRNKLSFFR